MPLSHFLGNFPSSFILHSFGDIGRRVAVLARAYEMRVVALRRNVDKSHQDLQSGLLVSHSVRHWA